MKKVSFSQHLHSLLTRRKFLLSLSLSPGLGRLDGGYFRTLRKSSSLLDPFISLLRPRRPLPLPRRPLLRPRPRRPLPLPRRPLLRPRL